MARMVNDQHRPGARVPQGDWELTFRLCLLEEHAKVKLADALGFGEEGVQVEPVAVARVGVQRGVRRHAPEAAEGVPMLGLVQDETHLGAEEMVRLPVRSCAARLGRTAGGPGTGA